MKQSTFVVILVIVAAVAAVCIWWFILGNPANFKDGANREKPDNLLGTVHVGGYVVPALIALSIMVITFIIERALSLRKARGRGQLATFLKNLQRSLATGDIGAAIQACDQQRGSMANTR